MHFSKKEGFTLIELLVVISIVSVLASIVTVSVQGARLKGTNARIIAETLQIRNAIEQDYSNNAYTDFTLYPVITMNGMAVSSYVAPQNFNSNISALITDITKLSNSMYAGGTMPLLASALDCKGTNQTQYGYAVGLSYLNGGANWNGVTIFVSPSCGPVTNYAVYSSFVPLPSSPTGYLPFVNTAYAVVAGPPTNPAGFAGYFCVDSSGNSTTTYTGWIPSNVTDGKCH